MSTDCPFRYEQFSALVFIRYGLSFLYKPVKGYKTHVDNAFPAYQVIRCSKTDSIECWLIQY